MGPEYFVLGILIGMLIMGIIATLEFWDCKDISQETLDDVCIQLTNNETAVGKAINKKLICELPSYDETQNIIIKTNAEE